MIEHLREHDSSVDSFEKQTAPKVIVPICSCCQKIHVDKKFWRHGALRLRKRTDILFSHGLCPHCYEEQRTEFMKFRSRPTPEQATAYLSSTIPSTRT